MSKNSILLKLPLYMYLLKVKSLSLLQTFSTTPPPPNSSQPFQITEKEEKEF